MGIWRIKQNIQRQELAIPFHSPHPVSMGGFQWMPSTQPTRQGRAGMTFWIPKFVTGNGKCESKITLPNFGLKIQFAIFSVTRRSRSDSVSQWVTLLNRVNWCDPGEWRYLLRTLLTRLVINDTYGCGVREIVVLIMEGNKVAGEVTDMEIDK